MCLILSEEYDQRREKNTSPNVIRLLYSLQIVLFNMFKMLNMYTWLGNECHFVLLFKWRKKAILFLKLKYILTIVQFY